MYGEGWCRPWGVGTSHPYWGIRMLGARGNPPTWRGVVSPGPPGRTLPLPCSPPCGLARIMQLTVQVEEKMKYAKWKAVEIGRCLKNGITPTPGPPGGNEEGAVGFYPSPPGPGDSTSYIPQDDKPVPKPRQNIHPPAGYPLEPPASYPPLDPPASYPPNPPVGYPHDPPGSYPPHPQPIYPPAPQPSHPPSYDPASAGPTRGQLPPASDPPRSVKAVGGTGGMTPRALGPEDVAKVQKMCKFASSALDYDDPAGAIEYLQDALALLTTAKNS